MTKENKAAAAAAVGKIRLWPTGSVGAGLGASPDVKQGAIRDRVEDVGELRWLQAAGISQLIQPSWDPRGGFNQLGSG